MMNNKKYHATLVRVFEKDYHNLAWKTWYLDGGRMALRPRRHGPYIIRQDGKIYWAHDEQ